MTVDLRQNRHKDQSTQKLAQPHKLKIKAKTYNLSQKPGYDLSLNETKPNNQSLAKIQFMNEFTTK